jgi:isoleucyl-tRNA synthetase
MSDWLYRYLTVDIKDAPKSVHLTDWPKAVGDDYLIIKDMQLVRDIVNEGLAMRAQAKLKVRQPLSKIEITINGKLSDELKQIIAEELNVKKVELKNGKRTKLKLDTKITQSLLNEGLARDIIRNIQAARKDAGLQVENRIKLALKTDSEQLNSAIEEFKDLISQETLTSEFSTVQKGYKYKTEAKIENHKLTIELQKI